MTWEEHNYANLERDLTTARARISALEAANTRMWDDYVKLRERVDRLRVALWELREWARGGSVPVPIPERMRELVDAALAAGKEETRTP